ncbi:DciA family protein [Streptomyces sp. WZ-12]|uniref:DciA family protein n=1 Tax=Streptomyces sp. WZ-12 TaxID=3030210 RepID=UPI0023818786|nr:DciA family protein [Streptomyces sp. WZ-12]
MSGDEISGVDLARVALRAAMEAARKSGGRAAKPKPRAGAPVRRDGRDPMGLSDVLSALVAERAWELPAAGASLRERWAAIAPELAGHVAVVSYDAEAGRLTVCPESPAWATKTRLEQARVIAAANASAGRTVIRALRILTPGSVPAPEPTTIAVPAAAPKGVDMTAPTINGHELSEGDALGHDQVPDCCHDEMTVEPLDEGFTDYRCTTCGGVLTIDEKGIVFDISG